MSEVTNKKSGIHLCWTTSFLLTINIGMIQFGFGMLSWNSLMGPFKARYEAQNLWVGDDYKFWIVSLTVAYQVGCFISALTTSFFMKRFDKFNMIMAMNIACIFGSSLY